jgi:hypothetical protein
MKSMWIIVMLSALGCRPYDQIQSVRNVGQTETLSVRNALDRAWSERMGTVTVDSWNDLADYPVVYQPAGQMVTTSGIPVRGELSSTQIRIKSGIPVSEQNGILLHEYIHELSWFLLGDDAHEHPVDRFDCVETDGMQRKLSLRSVENLAIEYAGLSENYITTVECVNSN